MIHWITEYETYPLAASRRIYRVNNVLELPLAERSRFLEDACRGDEELRRQVEELVASFAEAGNFLEDAIGAPLSGLY